MSENQLLDDGSQQSISKFPAYINDIYKTAVSFYGIYLVIWFILRLLHLAEIVNYSRLVLVDENDGLRVMAVLVSCLTIFLIAGLSIMIMTTPPIKEKAMEQKLGYLISYLIFILVVWISLSFAAAITAGIFHALFGLSEMPCLDIAAILVGAGSFAYCYSYVRKKLLEFEKEELYK